MFFDGAHERSDFGALWCFFQAERNIFAHAPDNHHACLVSWPRDEVVPRITLAFRMSESKSAELASSLQKERRLKGWGVSRLA